MAESSNFEIDGLAFRRIHPQALAERFTEIQELRQRFYESVFTNRSPEQVARFVGKLTLEKWRDPNVAVGSTARTGQERWDPIVSAAFDERTDRLVGFAYFAQNVSSKWQPRLSKLHVPGRLSAAAGKGERKIKKALDKQYVWGSEYVVGNERSGLAHILVKLGLWEYDPLLRGAWYPYAEETQLKANLAEWGYAPDVREPETIKGTKEFGPGATDTKVERWESARLYDTHLAIYDIPGAVEAIKKARQTMAA